MLSHTHKKKDHFYWIYSMFNLATTGLYLFYLLATFSSLLYVSKNFWLSTTCFHCAVKSFYTVKSAKKLLIYYGTTKKHVEICRLSKKLFLKIMQKNWGKSCQLLYNSLFGTSIWAKWVVIPIYFLKVNNF